MVLMILEKMVVFVHSLSLLAVFVCAVYLYVLLLGIEFLSEIVVQVICYYPSQLLILWAVFVDCVVVIN